ncbi:MAG: hypothetical protein KF773_12230 [Deltaproteobacteria bacterium]|nr:hypothetical protein [Deltaproteobacteria bacterium]
MLAFAREKLPPEVDKATGDSSRELGIRAAAPGGRLRRSDVVSPRARVGDLAHRQIFHGRCPWAATITYCVHVSSGPPGTTVLVRERSSRLGNHPASSVRPLANAR